MAIDYLQGYEILPEGTIRDGVTDPNRRMAVNPDGSINAVTQPSAKPGTGTTSQVAASATAVTILAANAGRAGATIVNDSTAILYLILSTTTPTSSVYTIALDAKSSVGAYYEVPFGYTGIIRGIWTAANGNAIVTELT